VTSTRYNQNIPFYLLAAAVSSFVLSLFLLQLFAGILFFLWVFEKNAEKKKAIDVLSLAVLVFGIVRIAAILFSKYPTASNESLYKEALFYLSFFSFNYYLKTFNSEKKYLLIMIFIGACIFASITGIISFNFSLIERSQSFSSGPTVFSSYVLAVLPVLIFIPFEKKNKKYLFIWILGIAIILTGIYTSLGRTNIAISVLIVLIGVLYRKINFVNLIIIAAIVSLFSIISFENNSILVSQRIENPLFPSERDVILKGAKMLLFDKPIIGFGPRTFIDIFPLFNELVDKGVTGWHNDFLQIYFESGIIGLLSFLLLLSVIYYKGIKLFVYDKINKDLILSLLLSVSCFVLLVTSGFITSPVLSLEFVLIITLLNSYWRERVITESKVKPN
jgi:O-antigen ligase